MRCLSRVAVRLAVARRHGRAELHVDARHLLVHLVRVLEVQVRIDGRRKAVLLFDSHRDRLVRRRQAVVVDQLSSVKVRLQRGLLIVMRAAVGGDRIRR